MHDSPSNKSDVSEDSLTSNDSSDSDTDSTNGYVYSDVDDNDKYTPKDQRIS